MALFDTVWAPQNLSFTGRHINGCHLQQNPHHFQFPAGSLTTFSQKTREHGSKLHHLGGIINTAPCWSPNTDVRDTKHAYHIEIEVPGITEKEKIVIQWMSPRSLIVEGTITRPDVGHGHMIEGEHTWKQEKEDWPNGVKKSQKDTVATNGATTKGMSKAQEDDYTGLPACLLEERKIGSWQRTFTLPMDVDMKRLRASLEGGLLRIELPKRDMTGEPMIKIQIE